MGSGKSTVGRCLARASDRYFLDTDALIETSHKQTIAEIFANAGEAQFRLYERDLAAWLAAFVKGAVISSGGGMPTVCDNLREIGFVVYLQCDFETIKDRLDHEAERDKRPLAVSIDTLCDKFVSRQEIYERSADLIVDATQSVKVITDTIMSQKGAQ
ncbi:shikimate kinase [Campylobacterota bacterium]|nr:shikimate kinase [Campylobacterota bacterium]